MKQISLDDLLGQISIALDAVEADIVGATKFHSKRVGVLCLEIGKYLGYTPEHLFCLAGCGLMHDNALTEYILSERPNKDQKLNLKTHCIIGEENVRFFPFPEDVKGFILYHHECADGSGTFGKKDGDYPEEAGIIALADQVDVRFRLQNVNVNKLEEILEFIRKEKGKRFNKKISEAALAVLDEKLIRDLKDENIFYTLKKSIPEQNLEMRAQELLNLSEIIAKIIDYKSEFTKEHSVQIANKAWIMGNYYHYKKEEMASFYLASSMHDIGKLFIPSAILEKPGKLTEGEFQIIKSHVQYTWDILHSIKGFENIAVWASEHHEKLNGTGYPFQRTEKELDFNSRLLACLDIYQAVREKRPYHPVRTHEETMKVLYDMADGKIIDKEIVYDLDQEMRKLPDGVAPKPNKE